LADFLPDDPYWTIGYVHYSCPSQLVFVGKAPVSCDDLMWGRRPFLAAVLCGEGVRFLRRFYVGKVSVSCGGFMWGRCLFLAAVLCGEGVRFLRRFYVGKVSVSCGVESSTGEGCLSVLTTVII